jgi:quinol monooxygenase YgiN
MSKQLYLTAHFELNNPDDFAPTFAGHAKASRAKPGCLFFYLIRDRDNPAKFATMECWENYDYFTQHTEDDEHSAFHKKIKKVWKEEPEVFEGELVMGME